MAPKFFKNVSNLLTRRSSSGRDLDSERSPSDKVLNDQSPVSEARTSRPSDPEPKDEEGTYTDYGLFLNALAGHVEELQDSIDYDYPVFAYNIVQKIKPAIDNPDGLTLAEMRQVAANVFDHCTRVAGAAKIAAQLMDMSRGVVIPGDWDKKGELLRALKRLARALSDEDIAPIMVKNPAACQFLELPVWFATCRKPTGSTTPSAYFGTQRGLDMELGYVNVSVPDVDDMALSGAPLPHGWEHDRDREVKKKKSRLLIAKCLVIQKEQFGFHVKKLTKLATVKEAVMYVHGYNNKFSAAAMKFALAAYKMKADAPLFMFSWPSFQSYQLYTGDEANAMWAVPHFLHFLTIALKFFGLEKVHLIAHSMGSRVVLYSLARLAPELLPEGSAKLGRLVLAAPDFDSGEFRLMAPALAQKMEHITVYCASDDQALQLSTRVHGGHPRLGDFRLTSAKADVHSPYGDVENIDTIDASGLESGLVRHGYIFSHAGVLEDACEFLKTGIPAEQRPALAARKTEHGLTYYTFVDPSHKASVIEQEMPEENTADESGFVR
ncbi:hypothetical protein KFL_004970010 [Klebsormidium nitens]|uniref:Alpha/beta hydrolase n=1 Tax=Klebsormidium nitens TaxID=105231 RepID=A0A1Y1IE16_KLENI|nr:hypothetical protein KFL_004970010 [Klebsormidium nitens]|eukprot:GAQ89204.1 hypothetical protein KFL_004970010 [Klebsormidium nitens]